MNVLKRRSRAIAVTGWTQTWAMVDRVVNENAPDNDRHKARAESKQHPTQWKRNPDLCHGQVLREKKQGKDRVA